MKKYLIPLASIWVLLLTLFLIDQTLGYFFGPSATLVPQSRAASPLVTRTVETVFISNAGEHDLHRDSKVWINRY